MGRCEYVKKILHIPNVKMAFYVDPSYTLENVVLIATASSVAEDKNWIKKWKLKPKEISGSQEFSYLACQLLPKPSKYKKFNLTTKQHWSKQMNKFFNYWNFTLSMSGHAYVKANDYGSENCF
jgi:hypothetical protein